MARQKTERDAGSVAPAGTGGERGRGFRALGQTVSRIAKPIAAKRGGGTLARLKAEWGAVVGAELAGICWPESLGFRRLELPSGRLSTVPHGPPEGKAWFTPARDGRTIFWIKEHPVNRLAMIENLH